LLPLAFALEGLLGFGFWLLLLAFALGFLVREDFGR
jgi:hypothetical protein